LGLGSATNISVRPRIASRGAIFTLASRLSSVCILKIGWQGNLPQLYNHTMPRPIHGKWKKAESTHDVAVARITRMTKAGIAAIDHLTRRMTMDQNGILTSTTTTSRASLIGDFSRKNLRVHRRG